MSINETAETECSDIALTRIGGLAKNARDRAAQAADDAKLLEAQARSCRAGEAECTAEADALERAIEYLKRQHGESP
jgi:hypothetical protein